MAVAIAYWAVTDSDDFLACAGPERLARAGAAVVECHFRLKQRPLYGRPLLFGDMPWLRSPAGCAARPLLSGWSSGCRMKP